jgi:hypothetical protein
VLLEGVLLEDVAGDCAAGKDAQRAVGWRVVVVAVVGGGEEAVVGIGCHAESRVRVRAAGLAVAGLAVAGLAVAGPAPVLTAGFRSQPRIYGLRVPL